MFQRLPTFWNNEVKQADVLVGIGTWLILWFLSFPLPLNHALMFPILVVFVGCLVVFSRQGPISGFVDPDDVEPDFILDEAPEGWGLNDSPEPESDGDVTEIVSYIEAIPLVRFGPLRFGRQPDEVLCSEIRKGTFARGRPAPVYDSSHGEEVAGPIGHLG